MGLMDLFNQGDMRDKLYAAAEKSNIPQGGVTGAAFKAMFPHGLGNQLFGKEPEPMPPLETPEGTALMADLASNMMVPGTFIGPKGLARLFGDDAAKGMLATAESKLAQGVPKESVFQELGVFKGPEGKWRYEIDDSGAAFRPEGMRDFHNESSLVRQQRMMNHPDLSAAYPDADLIAYRKHGERGAAYDGNSDTIYLPQDAGHPSMSPELREDMRSMSLHELQHAVQGREGFAKGGSPEVYYPDERDMIAREIFKKLRINPAQEAVPALDVYKMAKDYAAATDGGGREIYNRIAGEVEARAVQDRMNMSMDERRALFPEYAGRNDLIVRGLMSGGK